MVGYFIGGAPHVGSIHATVNRIWSSPKAGSKIDVQFIDKNTVLFRIDNNQMRSRVIGRKYWHISDVPLVVNEWSPESALNPPDLSAMPVWVDLKGVRNGLFSQKGLKCLTRAVGKFVKLHPNTERCTCLDVARVLAEIDLHQPLVEKIVFKDKDGLQWEIEVQFPWLPARCSICHGWGHKNTECKDTCIRMLRRSEDVGEETSFGTVPQEIVVVTTAVIGGTVPQETEVVTTGTDAIGATGTNTTEATAATGGMLGLLKELEALPKDGSLQALNSSVSKEANPEKVLRITLTDPTIEVFPATEVGGWATVYGKSHNESETVEIENQSLEERFATVEDPIVVSPSRFSPLMGIEEEEVAEVEDEVEEGEIPEETGHPINRVSSAAKKSSSSVSHKSSKQKVVRIRDLKFVNRHGNSKKTSVRKL